MLDKEIEDAKRLVRTDAYQMSVGELVNMYRDGELIINRLLKNRPDKSERV